MDQRGRVFGLHHRVALQRREGTLVTNTIGTMASGTVIDIQRGAGLAVVTTPQIFGDAVFNRGGLLFTVFRRQGFQIAGNRGQILIAEILQAMFDHVAHATKYHRLIVAASFQELGQFTLAPGA
ncbi:hypothetical protein D3C75_1037900 [compost metagenome]